MVTLGVSGGADTIPGTGMRCYIWAIANGDGATTRSFTAYHSDGTAMDDIKLAPGATLSFNVPIICSKFQCQHQDVSCVWREDL